MKISAPEGPIQPGAKGKISISIATQNMRTMKYRKEIELVTNDPDQKGITLTVTADIQEILSITPAYLNFGPIKPNSRNAQEIIVANHGRYPIVLTEITANPQPQMTIAPRRRTILKPGGSLRLLLTLTAGRNPGFMEGSVVIKTDLPALPEKTIFVRGEVMPGQ